jgi:hypothetical protein
LTTRTRGQSGGSWAFANDPSPERPEQRLFRRRDRFRPCARAYFLGTISVHFDEVPAAHETGCFPSKTGVSLFFTGAFFAFSPR